MRQRLYVQYWNIRIRIREYRFRWMNWYSLQQIRLGYWLINKANAYRERHNFVPIIQDKDRYTPATIVSRY